MNYLQIRRELFYRGHTWASIGTGMGISRQAVHQAIKAAVAGGYSSMPVMLHVAGLLDSPAAEMFPRQAHKIKAPNISHPQPKAQVG